MSFMNRTSKQITPTSDAIPPSVKNQSVHTNQMTAELFHWTLHHQAVAPCFIRDVFSMVENTDNFQYQFFWLGRVPCRVVRILGLVVGVQIYENRIKYTVDDGTSVIDCLHRPSAHPTTPSKTKPALPRPFLPLPPLKPVGGVGSLVRLDGRVVKKYGTREITVTNIAVCLSFNDEPKHWKEVWALHDTHYDISTPFTIPRLSELTTIRDTDSSTTIPQLSEPTTPPTSPEQPFPVTPIKVALPIASTPSTSSSSSASSSPLKSPQKLRHPSRLRSRDLTEISFRIYIKYYMDNAPRPSDSDPIESDSNSDTENDRQRSPCTTSASDLAKTPRPRIFKDRANVTPRPRPRMSPLTLEEHKKPTSKLNSQYFGFTLSYLRRVPVLAEMALRVIKAEKRRRLRKAKEKAKQQSSNGDGTQSIGSHFKNGEQVAKQVKQLFKWAILQLVQDGSICLWHGPVRPLLHSQAANVSEGHLWTLNSSSIPAAPDSIISLSTLSAGEISLSQESEVVVSDPEEGEEAYIPVFGELLAGPVETAIRTINEQFTRCGAVGKGATRENILSCLKKDDQWRYLGTWNVIQALEVLRVEKRAWCVRNGEWDLSV